MNYGRVYREFIADRLGKQAQLEVYETHHIRPRCLKGGDEPSNLIRLSAPDHLFAHLLLARIHGGALAFSFIWMLGMQKYAGRRSRRTYEQLRAQHRAHVSSLRSGASASEVTRQRQSEAAVRRFKDSEQLRRHIEARRGRPQPPG